MSDELSAGAIVGIVLGVIAVVFIFIVAYCWGQRHKFATNNIPREFAVVDSETEKALNAEQAQRLKYGEHNPTYIPGRNVAWVEQPEQPLAALTALQRYNAVSVAEYDKPSRQPSI
jgi:hypothetical protein